MSFDPAPYSLLFDWLSSPDPLPAAADAAIGFGHFDLRIPRLCGNLRAAGRVPYILFTGGVGAGTGSLAGPEADVFHAELAQTFPGISPDSLLIENQSTNTAENIRFTTRLLSSDSRNIAFGQSIRSVILVAHAPRLRRVRATWRKLLPGIKYAALAPSTTLDTERDLYRSERLSLAQHLVGEVDRLVDYPKRGWIEPISIPAEILEARDWLTANLDRFD